MGQVVVKGKHEALAVFNPVAVGGEPDAVLDKYAQAYALLATGDPNADMRFAALHERYPEDALVEFYWRRVLEGERTVQVRLASK